MKTLITVFGGVIAMALIIWLFAFYFAAPERKPYVACYPVVGAAGTGALLVTALAPSTVAPVVKNVKAETALACATYITNVVNLSGTQH